MRASDSELRILKTIRGVKKGQILINKSETGQVDVHVKGQIQGQPIKQVRQSGSPGNPMPTDRLRG